MTKGDHTYIMTNPGHTVLYTGVTANLELRVAQHKSQSIEGFVKKYHVVKLVYFESHDRIEDAIAREKQIKGKTRAKKISMISAMNPDWVDLSGEERILRATPSE